jgi:hypothetical protein
MTNLLLYFTVICQIESSGGKNMIGPGGCEGWLGMKEIAVSDVNRIAGTDYQPADRHDKGHCLDMFKILIEHYLPKNATMEQVALFWCRGTKKSKKKDRPAKVVEYLEKVRLEYERNHLSAL